MGWLMEPIYYAISWILLRWHWVGSTSCPRELPRHQLGLGAGDRVPRDHGTDHPVPDLRQTDPVAAGDAGAAAEDEGAADKYKGDQQTLREEA
jgi:hypothetical protein